MAVTQLGTQQVPLGLNWQAALAFGEAVPDLDFDIYRAALKGVELGRISGEAQSAKSKTTQEQIH